VLSRLRTFLSHRLRFFTTVEATLVILFLVQALRYLVGGVYSRVASASLNLSLGSHLAGETLPDLVEPATVSNELIVLAVMLLLPVVTLIFGRFIWFVLVAVIVTASGRYAMVGTEELIPAAVTVGGGLFYLAMLARHRARTVPLAFVFAVGIDQLYRAFGNTLDPSWSADYRTIQLVLSALVFQLALFTTVTQFSADRRKDGPDPDQGMFTFWGGVGLGALLFLQFSLLALPNAVLGRAALNYADYLWVAPALVVATMLPIIPYVRGQARSFISLFDSSVRGWSWMLILMLLIVVGTRVSGVVGGVTLVIAQFITSLLWWWLVRPRGEKERSFTGLWLVFGALLFGLLVVMDIFTYEYAFVRDFTEPLEFLNPYIPPLLRGFRGLGLAVILLGAFFAVLPMSMMQRRIAWRGGSSVLSLFGLIVVAGFGAGAYVAVQPPVIEAQINPATIRVSSYNIHAGYSEFFHYNLDGIAQTVVLSQDDDGVVLLQEVEAGRMTSFGVDQALWLARELGMDVRFFPTNEGLQGLAVLSALPIVFDDGNLIDSIGSQTGLQRVQVLPDAGVITIYNTWLDPLLDTGDGETVQVESSQQNQLSQIFGIISEHHPDGQFGRMIIGGTFNNVPDSDLIQRLRDNNLVEHFGGLPLELRVTFNRTGQQAQLDYLWTTPSLAERVIGSIVIETDASDHRLAVIEIDLQ